MRYVHFLKGNRPRAAAWFAAAGGGALAAVSSVAGAGTYAAFARTAAAAASAQTAAVQQGNEAAFFGDYRPLRRLRVVLDGKPVNVGTAYQGGNVVMVALDAALPALSGGKHALPGGLVPFRAASISVGPNCRLPVSAPMTGGTEPKAETGYPAQWEGRSAQIAEPAQWVRVAPDAPLRLLMDIQTLSGLMGITCEAHGETIYLFSPAYWCRKVGLEAAAGVKNHGLEAGASLAPNMGISPPAATVLFWVRPPQNSWVQVYALPVADEKGDVEGNRAVELPAAAFGTDVLNEPTLFPDGETSHANPRPVKKQSRTVGTARFWKDGAAHQADFGSETGPSVRYAAYVAVVSRTAPPPGMDTREAILGGKIQPGDWYTVGIRQRVGKAYFLYDLHTWQAGDSVEDIADSGQIPAAMLRSLNGLQNDEQPAPGETVFVARAPNGGGLLADTGGTTGNMDTAPKVVDYEVRENENLTQIADRTGASAASIQKATGLALGEDIVPGELITIPNPAKSPEARLQKPAVWKFTQVARFAAIPGLKVMSSTASSAAMKMKLNADDEVFEEKQNVTIGQSHVIVHKKNGSDVEGWVPSALLRSTPLYTVRPAVRPSGTVPVPSSAPLPLVLPGGLPQGRRIAEEALRWENRPRYQMGGANLMGCIDCSHFVEAVYKRAGVPCPEPPVHEMENHGSLVHWKAGFCEEGGVPRNFPATPPLSNLRTGDRIIFQCDPSSTRSGNHHTGIYLGAYRGMKNAVIHCNSSHGTVTVNELTSLWRIYRYAVRGAAPRKPGQWIASNHSGGISRLSGVMLVQKGPRP